MRLMSLARPLHAATSPNRHTDAVSFAFFTPLTAATRGIASGAAGPELAGVMPPWPARQSRTLQTLVQCDTKNTTFPWRCSTPTSVAAHASHKKNFRRDAHGKNLSLLLLLLLFVWWCIQRIKNKIGPITENIAVSFVLGRYTLP